MKENRIDRRTFIKNSALGAAAISGAGSLAACTGKPKAAAAMPMRLLGKTGLKVSCLAFGGGSNFAKNKNGEWEPMLERAVELGINYFDTASEYKYRGADQHCEVRFGEILPKYRDKVIISTKFNPRTVDEMMVEVETSLKQLKTDYIDILMIHSVEKSEDIDALDKGVYNKLRELKEQQVARFIGFSSMNSAEKSREFIEKLDPDVCILAMNPTQYGNFAKDALPAAREKKVGTLAMKVMRDIVGKDGTTPEELLRYVLSKDGVATALIAHHGIEKLEENVQLVKKIINEGEKTSFYETRELENRLAPYAGPHALCWAQPGYRDSGMHIV